VLVDIYLLIAGGAVDATLYLHLENWQSEGEFAKESVVEPWVEDVLEDIHGLQWFVLPIFFWVLH
jgi:hypothetical protein